MANSLKYNTALKIFLYAIKNFMLMFLFRFMYYVSPVTTTKVERRFSVLKWLKTVVMSNSGKIGSNGLALLSIHNEIGIDIEKIINRFVNSGVAC